MVDWSEGAAQELQARLQRLHGLQGPAADAGDWEVLNCPATPLAAGPGRSAAARLGRTLKYLGTACKAAWRSRRYAQVVVWQQAIGYLMCLLPRWPQWLCATGHGDEALRPRLVITTVLMSPSSLPPHSLRRAVLRLALWRADALVYFSREMAQDTARHHPSQAHKIFWTPLPQLDAGLPKAQMSRPG